MGDTSGSISNYALGAGRCPGAAGSAGGASGDVAYRFTPTAGGDYRFQLTTTTFDAALYVVSDCADIGTTCLGGANAAGASGTETVTATLAAGSTYYVIVDGASDTVNDRGTYNLSVTRAFDRTNPMQFDVSAALIHDSILNNGAPGGLDPTQDRFGSGNNMLMTSAAALAISPTTGNGLPDDAYFPANSLHPEVYLHWRNSNDGRNCRIMRAGDDFTFTVPAFTYGHVQIYGFAAGGGLANVTYTLTYRDGTIQTVHAGFLDWTTDPPSTGFFYLIDGLDIYNTAFANNNDLAIFGHNVTPDDTKVLTSIRVAMSSSNWFVFWGATGY
jgi:hypothetical protein